MALDITNSRFGDFLTFLGLGTPYFFILLEHSPSGLRPDRRGARRIDAWRDGCPETLENTTFLVAEGLEYCRTLVLEESRMVVDGWRDG